MFAPEGLLGSCFIFLFFSCVLVCDIDFWFIVKVYNHRLAHAVSKILMVCDFVPYSHRGVCKVQNHRPHTFFLYLCAGGCFTDTENPHQRTCTFWRYARQHAEFMRKSTSDFWTWVMFSGVLVCTRHRPWWAYTSSSCMVFTWVYRFCAGSWGSVLVCRRRGFHSKIW